MEDIEYEDVVRLDLIDDLKTVADGEAVDIAFRGKLLDNRVGFGMGRNGAGLFPDVLDYFVRILGRVLRDVPANIDESFPCKAGPT